MAFYSIDWRSSGGINVRNSAAKSWAFLCVAVACVAFNACALDTISTIAGDGNAQEAGDGGAASAASLHLPSDVAVDSAGNIYIADTANNVIRKIDTTGIISIVAGTGTAGYNSDGITATTAELNGPSGVAVDSNSNLYIADTQNHRIRFVSGGMISTVAGNGTPGFLGDGGPATGAELHAPTGVAVDGSGNVYIADTNNNVIRVVSAPYISRFAGDAGGNAGYSGDMAAATAATLDGPSAVKLFGGDVYIVDRNNNAIRKVSGGNITTVVGDSSGTASSTGDGGPATSATLYDPAGLAFDGNGNMYISESLGCTIREVSSGVINTVAGSGVSGFFGDNNLATSGQFFSPLGLAVNSANELLVADSGNHRLRKVYPPAVRFELTWDNSNDVDLHVKEPGGFELYYSQTTSPNGGFYITDNTAGFGPENVIYTSHVPAGTYTSFALNFDGKNADNYTLKYFRNEILQTTTTGTLQAVEGAQSEDLVVPVDAAPIIYSSLDVRVAVGQSVAYTILANGNTPITFNASSLPSGLSFSGTDITGTLGLGTYNIPISATNSFGTDNEVMVLKVVQPGPPVPGAITSSKNPSLGGDDVTFTATPSDVDNVMLVYSWDFGDGSALVHGSTKESSAVSITHNFPNGGDVTVTFSVTDGTSTVSSTLTQSVFLPNSGGDGVANIGSDDPPVANPLNGMSIVVLSSNGGVIQLGINVDALNRDEFSIATRFNDGSNLHSVRTGTAPIDKFADSKIYVATSTASDSTDTVKGMARKTLVLGRKETGETPLVTGDPSSNVIKPTKLTGKFAFANAAGKKPPLDLVTLSATVNLPVGLDISKAQPFALGIGNVVDTLQVSPKGKGVLPSEKQRIKKLQVKYPKLPRGTTLTTANQTATITVSLSQADLTSAGFDTEGVSAKSGAGTVSRSIQIGMVLAGVGYEVLAPVQLTVSKDTKKGAIIMGRSGN